MKLTKPKLEYIIIIIAVLCKFIIQLISTANSGYHGDELLHIEAGKHLALGYLDFPPLIGILAWIQNLFRSDSLYINHIFNYLNASLVLIFSALLVVKIGGKSIAVLITMLCLLLSPGFGASQYLFLPTAFEQLFWLIFIYQLVCFSQSFQYKYIIYAAIVAAFGFLNKYDILFLFGGFFVAVLIFQNSILKQRAIWLTLFVFVLLISPNIYWQISNDLPVFHHMFELYKSQLDKQSVFKELIVLILFLNPLTFLIWGAALFSLPFNKNFTNLRFPLFTMLFSFVFVFFAKGKSYYYFPIVIGLIPFGAVLYEQWLTSRKEILVIYLSLLSIVGLVLLPHGIPMLKLQNYINTYHLKPNADNKIPLSFENYYSNENWQRILDDAKNIYNSLPLEEKKKCLIWGRHYSIAGGINLLGAEKNLPPAFSMHSSFYSWVPNFSKDVIVIAIGESNWNKIQWERYFSEVTEMAIIENRYASEKDWYNYRIFLCKKPRYNSDELKQLFKNEIF
jgi:hypothetical protein